MVTIFGLTVNLDAIKQKALDLGAVKSIVVDAKDEFAERYIARGIKANASYQGEYHLSTPIGRPLLAKIAVQIAEEEGAFGISDVTHGVAEKMIRRHPHVFGGTEVADSGEVEANWAKLKAAEKPRGSLMEGIPLHLPALMRAYRLTQRASKVGFDWENRDEVWEKLQEELQEFQEAMRKGNKEELREELGDILFTLVNLARFIGVDPEDALRQVTNKFAERFQYIEKRLHEEGKDPHEASLVEMDALWEESKGEKRG